MQNVILHLDMNSYFASVEQQDNSAWRNKPLGVCEHLGGIIIAASIEAKKWGIKTGTPVWEAKKLYPKIILTHTRPEAYRAYNRRLVKLVSDYTDQVEVYSIDEVFMDITASCNIKFPISNFQFPNKSQIPDFKLLNYQLRNFIKGSWKEFLSADPFWEAARIAKEIKQRMKKQVGDYLTCSVGIGENKLIAKIASELKKPDGLVIIAQNQNAKIKMQNLGIFSFAKNELYNYLKLTDIPGIGHRMEKRLNSLGIKTLLDLKNYPKGRLAAIFGPIAGYHIYNLGQLEGSFKPEVEEDQDIKSMGHMYTLPEEYRGAKFFIPVLYKLCEMVGRRLRRQNLMGNVIWLYTRDIDQNCFGQSKRLGVFLWDGREIFLQAADLLRGSPGNGFKSFPAGYRLIGVTVSGLRPFQRQLSLFGDDEANRELMSALDKINQKYGDFTVCRAPVLAARNVFQDSIGFGRIKETLRHF